MKILALDNNHDFLNSGLRNAGFVVDEDYKSSKEEIMKFISEYDGIIIRSRFPIDKSFLEKATNLKFIGRVGAGLENIDEKFAKERNIRLFNAPEGNKDSVGEHSIAMLLMLMNRLKIADNEVRNGIWLREENRGDELMGKTVGIVGYGNMGKAFAQRLKGFGVEVICYDILENLGDENAKQVELYELFQKSDVVSLHTPQTNETNRMVNSNFINSFHKPFYLINTARGKSVVTKDLVTALESAKIKGACLDVHEYEKSSFENLDLNELPEDFRYLINSDKVILAPHIAGWTIQSKEKLAKAILDKILNWKASFQK
ncbi:2-hydroxyacid dehydrogenase [Moheibacter sediminis]|uniref:D-3-phosphoglycerate dehydrogenase n=1 Tax=Moheibacter sediminis TaxID=1434700 RepID=A0A1W1Y6W7_9FLAO|nr:2-hydroxyacid dehydrogenase [Moheibacter sediminis]SMC31930.1 D-3-phosphoglycerate dehydrogenase [Moheibacter sediminis]